MSKDNRYSHTYRRPDPAHESRADCLPPLERALPYLLDTLYTEIDSISRLLATLPTGSLSLIDLDFINHLITVSSEFRAFLQRSSTPSAADNARQGGASHMHGWVSAPSVSMPQATFPPEIDGTQIIHPTVMGRQEWNCNTVSDTRPPQQGPGLSPPLDPHCSAGAALPLPHPVVCSGAMPTGSMDGPQTFWRPHSVSVGEWGRSMFSRGVAMVQRLFRFRTP